MFIRTCKQHFSCFTHFLNFLKSGMFYGVKNSLKNYKKNSHLCKRRSLGKFED